MSLGNLQNDYDRRCTINPALMCLKQIVMYFIQTGKMLTTISITYNNYYCSMHVEKVNSILRNLKLVQTLK